MTAAAGDDGGGRFRWRALMVGMVLAAVAATAAIVWDSMRRQRLIDAEAAAALHPVARALSPMAPPRLDQAPPLPAQDAIAAAGDEAAQLAAQRQAPSLVTGLDATVVAWGERLLAGDGERPPVPQVVGGRDFAEQSVPAGAAVAVAGRMDANLAAPVAGREVGWRWLALALDDGQYAVALAGEDTAGFDLGVDVQVQGRYLGRLDLGGQAVPLVLARSATPPTGDTGAVAAVYAPGDLEEFHRGRMTMPADLYAEIDDERPILETRPYYYTLGQVKLDRSTPGVYDQAVDANRIANDIHQEPARFRGQVFTVTGTVLEAWEDRQVARDRPFEVVRVVRVLLGKADLGPITEVVDGVPVTSTKIVRRLYELAIAGDQPLPTVGATIAATGRFVKFRQIPAQPDAERDRRNGVVRQSDHLYAMLFVVPAYRAVPAAPLVPTVPAWHFAAVAGLVALAVLAVVLANRDRGGQRRLRRESLRLRKSARLPAAGGAGGEAQAGGGDVDAGHA